LGPGHGPMALFGCFLFIFFPGKPTASFGRRHIDTVLGYLRVLRDGGRSDFPHDRNAGE